MKLQFLTSRAPLARQVAMSITGESHLSGPRRWDLRDTEVWVATSSASRRIRHELAVLAHEAGAGVLPPRFRQPMAAMIPESPHHPIASQSEREAAWARAIRDAGTSEHLFPKLEAIQGDAQLFAAGGMLCDLCDLLAEGGLAPTDPLVQNVCNVDAERWQEIGKLYREVLNDLAALGLTDPNVVRLAQTRHPEFSSDITRIFIACVPDLPVAAEQFANQLGSAGVSVTSLVWLPAEFEAGFDAAGRPLAADWAACNIPLREQQIVRVNSAADEAAQAIRFVSTANPTGNFGILLADPLLAPPFDSAIRQAGQHAYVPDGVSLVNSEPGTIAIQWADWVDSGELTDLQRLLECPNLLRWLARRSDLSPTQMLRCVDFLKTRALADTRDRAMEFLSVAASDQDRDTMLRIDAAKLLDAASAAMDGTGVVRAIWGDQSDPDADAVIELAAHLENSPILGRWPAGREVALARALRRAKANHAASPGDLELSGWLEAIWSPAQRMVVCGLSDGVVPSVVTAHPFLPDSVRSRLGLTDNATRAARDTYFLSCLAASRSPSEFQCSFSKFGADGSPSLPSSLFFRCPDRDLPDRALKLFEPSSTATSLVTRESAWKWSLADELRRPPPTKISPTDFSVYLKCPFRFYLRRVLYLEGFDGNVREMDAVTFGSLMHLAIERFSKAEPAAQQAKVIAAGVLDALADLARASFGPLPSPAVRIQLRMLEVRLNAYAREQAKQMDLGWQILESERKLGADAGTPLLVGPLPLTAKVDRIESHPEYGIRILDFKSYHKAKTPAETHLGPAGKNTFLPEAATEVGGKAKDWIDLQLPLYLQVAAHWYPNQRYSAGIFELPSDPAETRVEIFSLTDAELQSAWRCAQAVASRVAGGVFWPPQEHLGMWIDDFAGIFQAGNPIHSIDPESAAFLAGPTIGGDPR